VKDEELVVCNAMSLDGYHTAVSTEARLMAIVLNRAMMFSVISMATEMTVSDQAATTVSTKDPGREVIGVLTAVGGDRRAKADAQRAAENVCETAA
jgi:hypothetical protein